MIFSSNKKSIVRLLLVVSSLLLSSTLPAQSASKVTSVIDAPGVSPFGLAFAGHFLWTSDKKTNTIYKIDMSGKVLFSFKSPSKEPGGLSWDGKHLWNTNPRANRIFKLNSSGKVISKFKSPSIFPYSIAWDGKKLINIDRSKNVMHYLYPSGKKALSVKVPFKHPGGIAWDGKFIWVVQSDSGRICLIDTKGKLVSSFYPPGRDSMDLTWGENSLWVMDSVKKKIYKMDVSSLYPKEFFIKGRITVDGRPLESVKVVQTGKAKQETRTDKDGRFSLKTIFKGKYTITPQKSRYAFRPKKLEVKIKDRSLLDKDFAAIPYNKKFFQQNAQKPQKNNGTYKDSKRADKKLAWSKTFSGDVVEKFLAPISDPSGIAWDGKNLWLSDKHKRNIFKLSPKGKLIKTIRGPVKGLSCLHWDGQYLWGTHTRTNKIYRLDTKGKIKTSISPPSFFPFGLSWDGEALWHSDSNNKTLYRLDKKGRVLSSFKVPFVHPLGIEWESYYIWVTSPDEKRIYKISEEGEIISYISSPAAKASDIALDKRYIWVVDQLTKYIYKIDKKRYEPHFSIAGTVSTEQMSTLEGVKISLLGKRKLYTTSDKYGGFNFRKLEAGKYALLAEKKGYQFLPEKFSILLRNKNIRSKDFIARKIKKKEPTQDKKKIAFVTEEKIKAPKTALKEEKQGTIKKKSANLKRFSHSKAFITGRISAKGIGIGEVKVTLSGDKNNKSYSDNSGIFTFGGLSDGEYTLTPYKQGYKFTPKTLDVYLYNIPSKNNNFEAKAIQKGNVSVFKVALANPSGIAWDGKAIWLINRDGKKLYSVNKNGEILNTFNISIEKPVSLAASDKYLWTSSVRRNKIYKLNKKGDVLSSFPTPGHFPVGVAWDKKGKLWHSDKNEKKIYTLTANGKILSSFYTNVKQPSGIAFSEGTIWIIDGGNNSLTQIDSYGNTLQELPAPCSTPKDITLIGNTAWVIDRATKKIYTISLKQKKSIFTVSGSVIYNTEGLPQIEISLAGKGEGEQMTDSEGNFVFTGVSQGEYTIAPVSEMFTFSPEYLNINLKDKSLDKIVFYANYIPAAKKQAKMVISGTVIQNGKPLQGINVYLSGSNNMKTFTNQDGFFAFRNLEEGTYRVTPKKAGYEVIPSYFDLNLQSLDLENNFFKVVEKAKPAKVKLSSISGHIKFGEKDLEGAEVYLNGQGKHVVVKSDKRGIFSFDKLHKGIYNISVSKKGYSFSPELRTVMVIEKDKNKNDFKAILTLKNKTIRKFTITGRITKGGGPLEKIRVVARSSKFEKSTYTNIGGNYSFYDIPKGEYIVAPEDKNLIFFPNKYKIELSKLHSLGNNFGAMSISEYQNRLAKMGTKPRGKPSPPKALKFPKPFKTDIQDVRKYNIATLSQGQSLDIPSYLDPEVLSKNMAMDGFYIWILDTVKKKIFKVDSDKKIYQDISIPSGAPSSIKIIANDLYISDANGKTIYHMDISSSRDRFSVSGRVSRGGVGIPEVIVTVIGDEGKYTGLTDQDGFYYFKGVKKGQYIITPYMKKSTFTPPAVSIAIIQDTDEQNFSEQVFDDDRGFLMDIRQDEVGVNDADVNISTKTSLIPTYADVTAIKRESNRTSKYNIPAPMAKSYQDGRCTSCKKGQKKDAIFPDAPVVINPYTKKPFLIYEIMCFRCHRNLWLNHPVGIFPRKVDLPWDAIPIKPGGRVRLTCRGCHDKDKGYYKYLRWDAGDYDGVNKIVCLRCHKDKTVEWAKSHRPIMQQKTKKGSAAPSSSPMPFTPPRFFQNMLK